MWRPVPCSVAIPGVWGAMPVLQRARMRLGYPFIFLLTLLSTSSVVDAMPSNRHTRPGDGSTVYRARGSGTFWSQLLAFLLLLLLSISLAGAMPRPKRRALSDDDDYGMSRMAASRARYACMLPFCQVLLSLHALIELSISSANRYSKPVQHAKPTLLKWPLPGTGATTP